MANQEKNPELGAAAVPVWNVETLREYVLALIAAQDHRLTERHDAQLRAIETAFQAQKTAMEAAFIAQKEAVTTAFAAQKEAVNAAMAAADRAVLKAETASEKRFEAVNEFRATLADQQRTLMPRSESESNNRALADKLESGLRVTNDKMETLSKTQASFRDVKTGEKSGWQYSIAVMGALFTLLGIAALVSAYLKGH